MNAKRKLPPLLAAALLAGALCGALPASATVGPPVKVHLRGDPRPALPGEPFTGEMEIISGAPAELKGFRLEGERWSTIALDIPAVTTVAKDRSLIVPFTAVTADPREPLIFSFQFNGQVVRKFMDLSPAHVARLQQAGVAVRAPQAVQATAPPAGLPKLPSPGPAPLPPGTKALERGDGSKKAWDIRVHGRFVYLRSDGQYVGADGATVRIYDEDSGVDEFLAQTITNQQGWYDVTFNWDPCWICDDNPDIYVNFEASNAVVEVEDPGTLEINYSWSTDAVDDYTGSDLDMGTLMPKPTDEQAAVHILNSISRAWRFVYLLGYDPDDTDVQWPDGTGTSWYSGYWEEIHITSTNEWSEATALHEYGHHWMEHYGAHPDPDYCNGICDFDGCQHCMWCQENGAVVWTEGWPHWFADVVTRGWKSAYLLAPLFFRDMESLDTCSGTLADPYTTEGFMAALLRDIEDDLQDAELQYPGFRDTLALGTDEILAVADLDDPDDPLEFLLDFAARYPAQREKLWRTARNCGYEFDQASPAAPTNLTSSHAINVPSNDPTAQFNWTRAYDDASGIAGYAVLLAAGAAGLPAAHRDILDVTTYTTAALTPSVPWYFSIRAQDKYGNWSAQYASYGPVVIAPPVQANLDPIPLEGWSAAIVPRIAADATPTAVPAPSRLEGDLEATYWNACGRNTGTEGTGVEFENHLYVDGVDAASFASPPVEENGAFYGINLGPVAVHGGRHVFEARLDDGNAFVETDETDNQWAHQWVWSPDVVDPDEPRLRNAPPDPTGGWEAIRDATPTYYNCDGLRFVSSGSWRAMSVRALADSVDYDCRLHDAHDGVSEGFSSIIAASARPSGRLDAVIVNRRTAGEQSWDLSVVNANGGHDPYEALLRDAASIAWDESLTTLFGQGEMIKLWEFDVPPVKTGPVSIAVRVDPPGQPITALWLDSSFQFGGLSNADTAVVTNASGVARIDLGVAPVGYNCLVIYRDPLEGCGPLALGVLVGTTPPDLAPYRPSGWYAPVVPTTSAIGPPVLPDTLYGDVAETYTHLALVNDSPTQALGAWAQVHRDGTLFAASYWSVLAPFENSAYITAVGSVVPGGRHTFTVHLDPFGEIAEGNEDNNVGGEQYCWSPLQLPMETPVPRLPPPNPTGGWDEAITGEPLFFNCDGLRLMAGAGGWEGVAIMPAVGNDCDLHLYPPLTGAKGGFAADCAVSAWMGNRSDFVLVNYNLLPPSPYDVGVMRFEGSEEYTAQAVASIPLTLNEQGSYGPWVLPAGQLLHLRAFPLEPGPWAFRLVSLGGPVDWGLSLHPAGSPFASKSDVVENGMGWMNGPGEDEGFGVEIGEAGWYCVAIWKTGPECLAQQGEYLLRILPGVTEVPSSPPVPAATALVSAYPNPFNPQSRLVYDLAVEALARLDIYNPQGKRVRTLVCETLPAGRHETVWDGRDDSGRQLASGVYLARLATGGVVHARKVVMLK